MPVRGVALIGHPTFPFIGDMDAATLQVKGRPIAKALRAISTKTGRPFSMRDKPGRFVIQKTVYLLRKLGYASAMKYDYNIYLNGPYSPDLAEVYYALEDDGLQAASPAPDISPELVETVADALSRGSDFLEGLTTVIDGNSTSGSLPRALAWAKSIKPHLGEPTWQEVRSFLRKHPELT
jgi:hypothetical protein